MNKGYKKLVFVLLALSLLIGSFSVSAENETCIHNHTLTSADCTFNQTDLTVHYFYGHGCPHCARVDPVIDELSEEFPNITFMKFEIYDNKSNLQVLTQHFEAYSVPDGDQGIPALFISDKYLIGDRPILENIEHELKEYKSCCPTPEQVLLSGDGKVGPNSPTDSLKALSLVTILSAALVDSINPCAIAVLLILLGALMATDNKKRAFKAGMAFTLSIYIVYFLFGVGLFSALQISGLSYWFYKVIGLIAIVIGLFNIKDYFKYGAGGFVMEIPRTWRPSLKKLLSSVTTPWGAFLIGFLVCLFELPCTGGPYIFILGLLAEKSTRMAAIPILLLYNVFFVLPLLVINIMVYAGRTNVDKASEWKERNIRKLHLIAGMVMVVLGIVVMSGIL